MITGTVRVGAEPMVDLVKLASMDHCKPYRVYGPDGNRFDWYAVRVADEVVMVLDLTGVVTIHPYDAGWLYAREPGVRLTFEVR